jgi:hypothetical protein
MNEVGAMPTLGIIKDSVLVAIILVAEMMAVRAATSRAATRGEAQTRAAFEVCGGYALTNGVEFLDGYANFSTVLRLAIAVIGCSQLLAALLQYVIFLIRHSE